MGFLCKNTLALVLLTVEAKKSGFGQPLPDGMFIFRGEPDAVTASDTAGLERNAKRNFFLSRKDAVPESSYPAVQQPPTTAGVQQPLTSTAGEPLVPVENNGLVNSTPTRAEMLERLRTRTFLANLESDLLGEQQTSKANADLASPASTVAESSSENEDELREDEFGEPVSREEGTENLGEQEQPLLTA